MPTKDELREFLSRKAEEYEGAGAGGEVVLYAAQIESSKSPGRRKRACLMKLSCVSLKSRRRNDTTRLRTSPETLLLLVSRISQRMAVKRPVSNISFFLQLEMSIQKRKPPHRHISKNPSKSLIARPIDRWKCCSQMDISRQNYATPSILKNLCN